MTYKTRDFMYRKLGNTSGFTLVEIIIVIALISFMSTWGVASYIASQKHARDNQRKVDLERIRQALERYYSENGSYPRENACDSSVGTTVSGCSCHAVSIFPASGCGGVRTDWDDGTASPIKTALEPLLNSMPKDPKNTSEHYYTYEPSTDAAGLVDCVVSDCKYYVLRARLEDPKSAFYDLSNP